MSLLPNTAMIRVDIWTGNLSQHFTASYHFKEDDPELLPYIIRELCAGNLVNLLQVQEGNTGSFDLREGVSYEQCVQ